MKHALIASLLLLAGPALAADPPADLPPVPGWSSAPGHCNWVWREGGGMGLWTEACSFDTGKRDVVYDAAQDLFTTTIDGKPDVAVLRAFRAPGGPEGLAATLKAQGLLLDSPDCQMMPMTGEPGLAPVGWTAWRVMPTGALKQAFDKEVQEQVPEPPCGKLGYAADTVSFFMVKDGAPGRVVFVDLGQERAMLDITTLRLE